MILQREYNQAMKAIIDAVEEMGAVAFADKLGVHNVHVYQAWNNNHITRTLEDALRDNGYLEQRPKRIRLAADVTEEQREALQDVVVKIGYSSWSDYVCDMADHIRAVEFVGRWSHGGDDEMS